MQLSYNKKQKRINKRREQNNIKINRITTLTACLCILSLPTTRPTGTHTPIVNMYTFQNTSEGEASEHVYFQIVGRDNDAHS